MDQYLLTVDAEGYKFGKNLLPLGLRREGRIFLASFLREVSASFNRQFLLTHQQEHVGS
jgi:hypothetical protein